MYFILHIWLYQDVSGYIILQWGAPVFFFTIYEDNEMSSHHITRLWVLQGLNAMDTVTNHHQGLNAMDTIINHNGFNLGLCYNKIIIIAVYQT